MRLLLKSLALLLIALVVGVPTGLSTFASSEREVVIGAHDATVAPRFDGWARIDLGPLLPRFRLPIDAPGGLGVDLRLGDTEVDDLSEMVARDAVIASRPEGEVEAVREAVVAMARDAALRGVGVGLLAALSTVVVWRAVGPSRRRELLRTWRRPGRTRVAIAAGTSVVVIGSLALVAYPDRPQPTVDRWLPLGSVFPDVPNDAVLQSMQVNEGATTAGSQALIEGALKTYRESLEFYDALAVTATEAEGLREPTGDETTAVVVTDRHDNIGMDPVARAVADRVGARLLIDLGDDTSNGARWEAFSLNSLAREFDGFDVVSVAGNHDSGPSVKEQMVDHGFTLMSGEPETVAGVRFIGDSDPRSSGLTAGYTGEESDNLSAIRDQDTALTEAACADGDTTVAVVHSAASAKQLAASGCVDLVLSGHLHRQVGPDVVEGPDGARTTTLTTASTGGAVYAFALGSKLRREAQLTVVTFRDGRPIGVQPVSFEPGGIVTPGDFTSVG